MGLNWPEAPQYAILILSSQCWRVFVYSRFNNDGGMRPEHTKVSHGAFMEVLDE